MRQRVWGDIGMKTCGQGLSWHDQKPVVIPLMREQLEECEGGYEEGHRMGRSKWCYACCDQCSICTHFFSVEPPSQEGDHR
jgi:hypothetical protein